MVEGLPSVVLIAIDALRYDCVPHAPESAHLRAARLVVPPLPAFSELVDGAYHFTQAIACAPYTPAAFASMLTGLLPPEHGVRAHAATSLAPGVRTLPDILRQLGYVTCAMTDYPEVLAPVGILRDFQTRITTEDEALAWWDGNSGQPRFLLLHLWDVHKPYGMPIKASLRSLCQESLAVWRERTRQHGVVLPADLDNQPHPEPERHRVNVMQCLFEQTLGWQAGLKYYLDGLELFDRGRLGELVSALRERGVLQSAIVVVTSDHGEGRSQEGYGRLNHSTNLLDDVIRVPLFVRLPGHQTTMSISPQVSQADITPTILDMVGALDLLTPGQAFCSGRSLLPLMSGRKLSRLPAYAEISSARRQADTTIALPDDPPSVVRRRILRYPERKYYVTGMPRAVHAELLQAPAEAFVRGLYRNLLGRFEDTVGLAAWLALLADEGPSPDMARRRAIVEAFRQSPEATQTLSYAVYDLIHDPLEERPRTPAGDRLFWLRYGADYRRMEIIEQTSRRGAPLLPYESDEDIIRKRLEALGYVE